MESIVLGLITTIVSLWLGSIEWRLRNVDEKMSEKPSRDEVEKDINLRLEVVKSIQADIKEDLKDIKHKLDNLLGK